MAAINVIEGDTHTIVILVKDIEGTVVDLSAVAEASQHMYIRKDMDTPVLKDITGEYPNGGADGVVTFSVTPASYDTTFTIGTFIYGITVTTNGTNKYTVAKDAIKVGAKVFWLQYGIENDEAKKMVESKNIFYISNKCIKQEYQRLFLKVSPVFPALKN